MKWRENRGKMNQKKKKKSCVSRSANAVAHSLARFGRSVEDEVVWLEDIPPPALQAPYEDSNSI